jgi:hypothetical protein
MHYVATLKASAISNQDSTLGVGTMDTPLSDAGFLLASLHNISQINGGPATEAMRLSVRCSFYGRMPDAQGVLLVCESSEEKTNQEM